MAKIQRKKSTPAKAKSAEPSAPTISASRKRGGRVRTKLLVQFTSQLATLQNAGLPIVRSLRVLAGQQRPGPFQSTLSAIADDVESGDALSTALAKHDHVFDELYLNMVRAGEAGGLLDEILERLAAFAEKAEAIRSKIFGALAYPIFVSVFAFFVVIAVIVFIVPRFQEVFEQLGATMPGPTQFLINTADFLKAKWWVCLLIAGVVLGGLALAMRAYAFRRFVHKIQLKMPLFGNLFYKTIVARFSRTLGTLLASGVPVLDAIGIVRDSVRNLVVTEALDDVHRNVRQGEPMTRPLAESGVFDDIVVNMVDVGEESGNVDQMLVKVADAYEREVDDAVDTLFKIIEPLLLLVLAFVVGGIVISLFLPILEVMDKLATR